MREAWATSPAIIGLPGLKFTLNEKGTVLGFKNSAVLQLLVGGDSTKFTADCRSMMGIRIGVWFLHGLKVLVEHGPMKQDSDDLYRLI